MRILILEDEPPIASLIEDSCRSILGNTVRKISIKHTIGQALEFLKEHQIDLCLLDLNLSGKDGFDLLRQVVSMPFQTIVISAYGERAIEAYELGVIDFIEKPFGRARLQLALDRFLGKSRVNSKLRYLVFKKQREHVLLPLDDVMYFKADREIVRAFRDSERPVVIDKHLNQLERVLPDRFIRIHRSYIVNINQIKSYGRTKDGNPMICLKCEEILSVSRTKIKLVKDLFHNIKKH